MKSKDIIRERVYKTQRFKNLKRENPRVIVYITELCNSEWSNKTKRRETVKLGSYLVRVCSAANQLNTIASWCVGSDGKKVCNRAMSLTESDYNGMRSLLESRYGLTLGKSSLDLN